MFFARKGGSPNFSPIEEQRIPTELFLVEIVAPKTGFLNIFLTEIKKLFFRQDHLFLQGEFKKL